MSDYWDGRFSAEGEIWGRAPSATVEIAIGKLREAGAKSVLVPGCGYGRNAEVLSRAGFTVTGVEISGRALALHPRPSEVTYLQGSVLDGFPKEHLFDAIYCFNVLHLFRQADRARFLSACAAALTPGGTAFFVVFSDQEASMGKGGMVEPMTWESKPGRPVHYFSDEDLRAHFRAWSVLSGGLIEDPESHGAEGPHTHRLRWICARAIGSTKGGKAPGAARTAVPGAASALGDFDGEAYGKASTHQTQWGKALMDGITFRGDERVLDLGCGDGALTLMIAGRVPRGTVRGIDSSAGMIRAARARKAPHNVSFELADVLELDAEAAYDLIYSNAALHWVLDHGRLLTACRRALTPGGTMRLSFAADGNCPSFIRAAREAMALTRFAAYFEDFQWPWFMPELGRYREILDTASLKNAEAWIEPADKRFPDKEALVRWIDQPSLVPFLAVIGSDEDRAAFRDHVIGRVVEDTRQADGSHVEQFRRMNVRWRKG